MAEELERQRVVGAAITEAVNVQSKEGATAEEIVNGLIYGVGFVLARITVVPGTPSAEEEFLRVLPGVIEHAREVLKNAEEEGVPNGE